MTTPRGKSWPTPCWLDMSHNCLLNDIDSATFSSEALSDEETEGAEGPDGRFRVSGAGASAKCTESTFDLETVKRKGGRVLETREAVGCSIRDGSASRPGVQSKVKWETACKAHNFPVSKTIPEMLATDLDLLDVYLALFPCPEQPVKITQKKMHETFFRRLARIGTTEVQPNTNDLGLKISDVLEGVSGTALPIKAIVRLAVSATCPGLCR